MNTDIIYGKSVCGVSFGSKEADVKKLLGKPSKVIDVSGSKVWVYNKQMIQIWFDCDREFRVTLVQVFNPDIKLNGEQVFLKKKEKIEELFLPRLPETDDVYDFQQTLFYRDLGLWLNFQFNKLFGFELGVLYNAAGEEIWEV